MNEAPDAMRKSGKGTLRESASIINVFGGLSLFFPRSDPGARPNLSATGLYQPGQKVYFMGLGVCPQEYL